MNTHLREEYRELLRQTFVECDKENYTTALLEWNRPKNRYNDVLPKEETRVKLSPQPNIPGSDYINANIIVSKVKNKERTYICSQAPLKSTFEDFWRMIWEQNVGAIVILMKLKENGKVKGDRYWPKKSGPHYAKQYGSFIVEQETSVTVGDQFTVNIFLLKHQNGSTRTVAQFYFQGWPDFGVPESTVSIRKLVYMLNEYQKQIDPTRPTVIHCSAGIGRTGTFVAINIALDIIIEESEDHKSEGTPSSSLDYSTLEYDDDVIDERTTLSSGSQAEDSGSYDTFELMDDDQSSACSCVEENGFRSDEEEEDEESFHFLDVLNNKKLPPIKDIVISLRKQRNRGMVQTEEQYRFIYKSVLDELISGQPFIPQKVKCLFKERTL